MKKSLGILALLLIAAGLFMGLSFIEAPKYSFDFTKTDFLKPSPSIRVQATSGRALSKSKSSNDPYGLEARFRSFRAVSTSA